MTVPAKKGVALGVVVGVGVAVAGAVAVLVLTRVGVAGVMGMGVLVGVGGDGRSQPVVTMNKIIKKAAKRTAMFIRANKLKC